MKIVSKFLQNLTLGITAIGYAQSEIVQEQGMSFQNAEKQAQIDDIAEHISNAGQDIDTAQSNNDNLSLETDQQAADDGAKANDSQKFAGTQHATTDSDAIIEEEQDHLELVQAEKMANDDQALSVLKTADDHRNHRLHFSFEQSLTEAIRLYDSVIIEKDVSPDLKARAKLNLAKIYVTLIKHNIQSDMALRSKEHVLALINEILTEPSYSQDLKGWARRFQAKLYLKGFYSDDMKESAEKAYALLHENLSLTNLDAETRSRTRMQLAHGYLTHAFSVPKKNPIALAKALYIDVINDIHASADMHAKARLALATYTEFYQDTSPADIQKIRLDYFEDALNESGLSPVISAHIKRIMAKNYLMHAFSSTPHESRDKAHDLLTQASNEENLPNKQKLFYAIELAEHYLNCLFNLKPSKSRAHALKLFNDISNSEILSPEQSYEFHLALAGYHVKNAFAIKPEDAHIKALEVYSQLLEKNSLNAKQKADVRWILANLYAAHTLVPSTNEPSKAAVQLFQSIFSDASLTDQEKEIFLSNLITLTKHNAFGIEQTKSLILLMPELQQHLQIQ